MSKIKSAIFSNNIQKVDLVYSAGRRERVADLCDLYPETVTGDNFSDHADNLADVEVVFSTWGMWALEESQFAKLPNLKIVFYGAGSVKNFAPALYDHGVRVMSAWGANGIPVAEFAAAQILLSCKGYWRNTREIVDRETWRNSPVGNGMFNETVALLGCGMIGRHVIKLLKAYELDVAVVDPYVKEEQLKEIGVSAMTIDEAFAKAYVISNHVPNLPQLKGMITKEHFESMREGATFINTGRGAQVDEAGMIEVLKKRADLTALLDVTYPEPPEDGAPFYDMSNVHLTSHIAGSINNECIRMADFCIEEFLNWRDGKPLRYEVTPDMLATMA